MAAPTLVRSVGPNGTRKATLAPYITDTVDYTGSMSPKTTPLGLKRYTSKEFQDAYAIAHREAGPEGTAIVWMEPGDIEGYSAGATSDAALDSIGLSGRSNRILFYPRQGHGSINIVGKSARFNNLRNIAIGGLAGGPDDEFGLLMTYVNDVTLWRSTFGFINVNGQSGVTSKNVNLDEVVVLRMRIYESDTSGWRTASQNKERTKTSGALTHVYADGCYFAPTYRPSSSTSHTDTVQFSGDFEYGEMHIKDTYIVGSTNHGLIIGSAHHVSLDNVWIAAGYAPKIIYPPVGYALPPSEYAGRTPPVGAGAINNPISINGGGQPGQFKMTNVVLIGPIKNSFDAIRGSQIVNVRTNTADDGHDGVVYDGALENMTYAQLTAVCPKPTYTSLRTMWSSTYVPPEGPPVEPPTADTTKPVAAWVSPAAISTVPSTAFFVITATDNVGVASIAFAAQVGTSWTQLGPGQRGSGDEWTFSFNATGVPSGTYPIRARVSDAAGNYVDITRSFVVDNTAPVTNKPPTSTFLEPTANTVLPRQGVGRLRARGTDDLYVAKVEFFVRTPTATTSLGLGELTTNGVYELPVDYSVNIPSNATGLKADVTDSGSPALTTSSGWVPVSVAAEVNTEPPSEFDISAVVTGPNSATATATQSVDPNGQEVGYRWLIDDLQYGELSPIRSVSITSLPEYEWITLRAIAEDPDGNQRSSQEITFRTWASAPPSFFLSFEVTSLSSTRLTWEPALAVKGEVKYDVYLDGSTTPVITGTTATTYLLIGLTRGGHSARVVAYVESERSTSSNTVNFDTNTVDDVAPLAPVLRFGSVTPTSIPLSWALQSTEPDFDHFVLRRPGKDDLETTATSITETGLAPASDFTYSVWAVDLSGNVSDAATITVRTLDAPAVIQPRWVSIHGPIADGVGPANGTVLVSYSADVTTLDGVSLTTAPQLILVSDGEFVNAQTGLPVQLYRSPSPDHYIVWVERLQTIEGSVDRRPRKFRLPSTTEESVGYDKFLWFLETPVGSPMPPWAQNLEAQVASVQQAAATVTDALSEIAFSIAYDAATQRYVINPRGTV